MAVLPFSPARRQFRRSTEALLATMQQLALTMDASCRLIQASLALQTRPSRAPVKLEAIGGRMDRTAHAARALVGAEAAPESALSDRDVGLGAESLDPASPTWPSSAPTA